MVLSIEDKILIKALRCEIGCGARKLTDEFLKTWTLSGFSYHIRKIDATLATGSVHTRQGSGTKHMVC